MENKSQFEIRIFDHKNDTVCYKRLTEKEAEILLKNIELEFKKY